MTYFDELKKSMDWLGEQPDTYFVGQAVACDGTAMTNTLKNVSSDKKLELPVFEEVQLGLSIGLALEGYVPVSIFPRWNFLLCAMNQLVNHLDKYPLLSDYRPKVIVRTGIGSVVPLHPQMQHCGDFTEAVQKMCKTVKVKRLDNAEDIFPAYQEAYHAEHSTVLVEISDFYNDDFMRNYKTFTHFSL